MQLTCMFSSLWRTQSLCEINTEYIYSTVSCQPGRPLSTQIPPDCLLSTYHYSNTSYLPRGNVSQQAIQQKLTQCSLCKSRTNSMCTEEGADSRKVERAFTNANQCSLKPQE